MCVDTNKLQIQKNKSDTMPGPASSIGRVSAYKSSDPSSIQQMGGLFYSWQLKHATSISQNIYLINKANWMKNVDLKLYSIEKKGM